MRTKLNRAILFIALCFVTILTQSGCSLFQKKPVIVASTDRVLKKKIVMTAFAVRVPTQVEDLDDVAQGVPREMLQRLERSGSFAIRQSPNLLSYEMKQDLGQVQASVKLVQQVAAENDAQFVIAGEVRNAGLRVDQKYWGLWETRSRHIEIEFVIYDGVSGALLARHHLYRPADKEAKIGRDKPFGSVAFYATDFGKAMDAVLEESVGWIRKDLAPYPMMARILKLDGQHLVFDAGIDSNVMVGDVGLLVANYDELPVMGLSAIQARPLQYGTAQASMGQVIVSQSQLGFSIADVTASVESEKVKIKVGDFVRFDPKR